MSGNNTSGLKVGGANHKFVFAGRPVRATSGRARKSFCVFSCVTESYKILRIVGTFLKRDVASQIALMSRASPVTKAYWLL